MEAVRGAIEKSGKIITVEDHNIINGLGSAVCEVAAEMGKGRVLRVGVQDQFGESAPYEKLLEKNGITAENICSKSKRADVKREQKGENRYENRSIGWIYRKSGRFKLGRL